MNNTTPVLSSLSSLRDRRAQKKSNYQEQLDQEISRAEEVFQATLAKVDKGQYSESMREELEAHSGKVELHPTVESVSTQGVGYLVDRFVLARALGVVSSAYREGAAPDEARRKGLKSFEERKAFVANYPSDAVSFLAKSPVDPESMKKYLEFSCFYGVVLDSKIPLLQNYARYMKDQRAIYPNWTGVREKLGMDTPGGMEKVTRQVNLHKEFGNLVQQIAEYRKDALRRSKPLASP